MRIFTTTLLVLALGCGDDATVDPGDAPGDAPELDLGGRLADGGAPVEQDAFLPEGRFEIVGGDWTMPAGQEGYVCVRRTVPETVYVRAFYPIAPEGTHHTVVTVETDPSSPDGTAPCAAFTNAPDMIYGSGVGTEPLTLPEGIAVQIPAGAQILLNLHLFNVGGETLSGHSGVEVDTVTADAGTENAQVLLVGNESFVIPPATADHWVEGRCTAQAATTIFAVSPHMHQYGDYMEIIATTSAGSTTLLETIYSFDNQRYSLLATPIELAAGDTIDVRCRYQNPTSDGVSFGDSSLQEMCYGGIFSYPPLPNGDITCTN